MPWGAKEPWCAMGCQGGVVCHGVPRGSRMSAHGILLAVLGSEVLSIPQLLLEQCDPLRLCAKGQATCPRKDKHHSPRMTARTHRHAHQQTGRQACTHANMDARTSTRVSMHTSMHTDVNQSVAEHTDLCGDLCMRRLAIGLCRITLILHRRKPAKLSNVRAHMCAHAHACACVQVYALATMLVGKPFCFAHLLLQLKISLLL